MIKAIVFDIGGILEIITPNNWLESWEKKLNFPNGYISNRLSELWKQGSIGTISENHLYTETSKILQISIEEVNNMMNDIWTEYLGELNVKLYDYFKNLRPKYKTAILSNSFIGAREKEQDKYKFEDICDFIIYSHEVGISKPNKDIYDLLCKRLELQPNEVIFLDDVKENIDSAIEFGIHAILFKNTEQSIEDIEFLINSKH